MIIKRLSALAVAALVLAACATDYQSRPNQTAGTLIGAAAGGLAGAQFGSGTGRLAATAAGTLLGAWLGSEVGASMDRTDQLYAQRAHTQALNSGQTIHWQNPDSGHYGSVQPTRTGYTETGQTCREFQTTVTVGGQPEQAYGTACQQSDGSWRIVR
jgi:surface antigen